MPRVKASPKGTGVPSEQCLPQELIIEVIECYFERLQPADIRKERRSLSLVCHSWRRIIGSTPSLWRRIYMHHYDWTNPKIPDAHLRTVLEQWYQNAGGIPLELEAHFYSPYGACELAKNLRETASRWKSIKLHSFRPLDLAVDAQKSARRVTNDPIVVWDQLETAEIHNADCDVTRNRSYTFPRPVMPRLRSLTFLGGRHSLRQYFSIFPFKQLRSITLADVWVIHLGTLLQECARLEGCTIRNPRQQPNFEAPDFVETTIRVPLSNLGCLRISGTIGEPLVSNSCNPILCPNIREVEVDFGVTECQPPDSRSTTFLREMLLHSRCDTLTMLTFRNPGGTQENLTRLLAVIPSLRHLDLSHAFVDLDFLAKWNSEKTIPALETFRLETLATLWPKISRVGKLQQDKLNGRDLVKLKYHRTQFNKFTKERGLGGKLDIAFSTRGWSVQLVQAEFVATTIVPTATATK